MLIKATSKTVSDDTPIRLPSHIENKTASTIPVTINKAYHLISSTPKSIVELILKSNPSFGNETKKVFSTIYHHYFHKA